MSLRVLLNWYLIRINKLKSYFFRIVLVWSCVQGNINWCQRNQMHQSIHKWKINILRMTKAQWFYSNGQLNYRCFVAALIFLWSKTAKHSVNKSDEIYLFEFVQQIFAKRGCIRAFQILNGSILFDLWIKKNSLYLYLIIIGKTTKCFCNYNFFVLSLRNLCTCVT